MIVREYLNQFILIEQDHHAHISGEMINKWHDDCFIGKENQKSVSYAIYNHDVGWKAFDKQPFWNDEKQRPYTFIDFPTPAKVLLYKYGIDAIEQHDPYAALLCSEHYTRFLMHDDTNEAQAFVRQEKRRQQQIIETRAFFDKQAFDFHYGLLQLCDNLSLYMCLNEPNVSKENEHPFFRDGIPLSPALHIFNTSTIQLNWKDEKTIQINALPFLSNLTIQLKQKILEKETIRNNGLIKTYKNVPLQTIDIQLIH